MCNELTTLMQVMEDPPSVSHHDLMTHKTAILLLSKRLAMVEKEIEGLRNTK